MILGLYNYWVVVALMMIGFYIIIAQGNLVKKLVGLTLFQTSVFIFYISNNRHRNVQVLKFYIFIFYFATFHFEHTRLID